jgi:ComF family protein
MNHPPVKIMNVKLGLLEDFVSLLFPSLCASCDKNLYRNEALICTQCLYDLPKTNHHFLKDNPVSMLFWGRVNIESAAAYYFFEKGSRFRRLIHKMKYRGQKEIGYELGKIYGSELSASKLFNKAELIIPVPLHPRKERKRGYNQSEWIAKGIAESMGKTLDTHSVVRAVDTESQTRKGRYERWKNVENIFVTISPDKLENKYILIVDDVITTGSTFEACAHAILKIDGTKVSCAALAMA